MKDCNSLPDKYEGVSVKDIPELSCKLQVEDRDYRTWITTFRCQLCGQQWIEKYVATGHGEVPVVFKSNTD